ncbi:MAG: nucleotidyltransferase domain-containing protein, partial [Nanoarchaeota archaeon]
MLHNKHFEIIEQFLGNFNREIYGRELVRKVSLSQKAIALTLDELERGNILVSRRQGNIKYFRLNLENMEMKDILISVEISRKIIFLKKHRKLAHILKSDTRIVGIFGSYARGTQKRDSDIDLFIIGERRKEDYDKKGRLFDLAISIKYFPEKKFIRLIKSKNNLCKEIIGSHIIIS